MPFFNPFLLTPRNIIYLYGIAHMVYLTALLLCMKQKMYIQCILQKYMQVQLSSFYIS